MARRQRRQADRHALARTLHLAVVELRAVHVVDADVALVGLEAVGEGQGDGIRRRIEAF